MLDTIVSVENQAVQLENELKMAARNSMVNQDAATQLNMTDPTLTFQDTIARIRTTGQPDGCFVVGTLVHTKEGLVPIEKLRVGDWVLSQPELKGELAYRQVVETFAFADKEVCLLEYFVTHEVTARNLVVTGNHPFWVKDVGWTRADKLSPGANLELHDGRAAYVYRVRKLFKTATPDVGWTYDDDTFLGPTIDLRDGKVQVSKFSEEDTCDKAALETRESLTRQVFNVEVEGFHTYYVGEVGVWVHNSCGETGDVAATQEVNESGLDATSGIDARGIQDQKCSKRGWQTSQAETEGEGA